jgi:ATP-dependent Clp protease ATP-binding subunit ClpC
MPAWPDQVRAFRLPDPAAGELARAILPTTSRKIAPAFAMTKKIPAHQVAHLMTEVLSPAQDAARALGHGLVTTEHVLLALIERDRAVADLFEGLGVPVEVIRQRVAAIDGRHRAMPDAPAPSPRTRKILAEALTHDQTESGSGRVLLAILDEEESDAVRVLHDLDVDLDAVRAAAARLTRG